MGMEAWGQTVQQAHDTAGPSLLEFLSRLPVTQEAQILYGLCLFGLAGLVASWLVKWSKNEVGSLRSYLFKENARRTFLSVFTLVGTFLSAVVSGVFFTDAAAQLGEAAACAKDLPVDKVFVGWINVLWVGATTGFGVDATINKGEREQWTEEQRVAAKKPD